MIYRADLASKSALVIALATFALSLVPAKSKSDSVQDHYTVLNKQFDEEIYDLLDKHCFMCHSGSEPEANLDLTLYETAQQVEKNPEKFQKVILNLRSLVMPPTEDIPTLAEREKIVDWINRALSKNGTLNNPGKVTIRRLNKSEYNYTIQDLVGISGDFSRDFPSDDVGYGFDNIGDVLTLTPLHLEMYLNKAREIAELAIPARQSKENFADLTKGKIGSNANITNEGDIGMFSNGIYEIEFKQIQSGGYELIVDLSATATQVGPAESEVFINGQLVQQLQVKTSGPTRFKIPIQLNEPIVKVSVSFTNDYYQPNDPDPSKRDRNLSIHAVGLKGPTGDSLSLSESERRILISRPTPSKTHLVAAREVLNTFASKAYRRPLTSQESNRLMELYQLVRSDGESFEKAIQVGIQAILVNPNFIFRVELDSSTSQKQLTDYELASRLSYFLWNSVPDAPLTDLARQGKLQQPATLSAQVERMLSDPRALRFSQNFAIQWLQIGRIEEHSADPELFHNFTDELKVDLTSEATTYFHDMLVNSRPITEFIDGKYTFLNSRLARHYRISGEFSSQLQRVDVSSHSRGGLLGMGAILTVTSNPNRTSPVKRGKFILEQLLGTPPPPPPPNVGVLEDTQEAITATRIRERLEQHRRDPACASCHRPLDAYGFTLESFNAVGQIRTQDGPFLVDDKGELPGKVSLNGVNDLKKNLLLRKSDFARTLTEKLMTYALGRGITPTDEVMISELTKRLERKGVTLKSIIHEIVLSDSFRHRSTK